MIEAKVRAFRGCVSADIQLAPLCLLAGKNHQGKSSIAQAIAAAMTQSPVPFFRSAYPEAPMFGKTEAKGLVNDADADTKQGGVRVDIGKDRTQIAWPGLESKTTGSPVKASTTAAGLVTPIEMPDGTRSPFFVSILQAVPTKEDFFGELAKLDYPVADHGAELAKIWGDIEINGWTPVHKRLREEGTKKKGAWERVTGERFGSQKAENYVPDGYLPEFAETSLDKMADEIARKRQQVDDLLKTTAVSENKLEQLKADAEQEDVLAVRLPAAGKRREAAQQAFKDAEAALAPLRRPHIYACEHCGGKNKLIFARDGTFTTSISDVTDEQLAQLEEQRVEAAAEQQSAAERLKVASDEWHKLDGQHKAVEGSRAQLESAADKTGDSFALATAQDELRTWQKQHDAKSKHHEAHELRREIANIQTLINVTDDAGLRKHKMLDKIEMFNAVLAGYSATAGFETLAMDHELLFTLGDRPYALLSDSEKYRCRAILQIAVAVYEKSNFAIFDGADILDPAGRNGLLTLLSDLTPGFHALVVMTFAKRELVPDLAKMKMGNSYWVEGGKVAALVKD